MKGGIARKLMTTYIIIIASMVINGMFCLYVLSVNLHTNAAIKDVTIPSIDDLKQLQSLMLETKKLANTWVYIANSKDQERLKQVLAKDIPGTAGELNSYATRWASKREQTLLNSIMASNTLILDSVKQITVLLKDAESYTDDPIADRATELNSWVGKSIAANDKRIQQLVTMKKVSLEHAQNFTQTLLYVLFALFIVCIILVVLLSYLSLRYSRKNIIRPILDLNRAILKVAIGDPSPMKTIPASDEIGQMQNSVNKMIEGIVQKMNFAEQIGKGNYDAEFALQSEKDKLGLALIDMRNDLKRSTEILLEQDKRLLDAQKMARIGNYYYDLQTSEFQSSAALDEILGIDKPINGISVDWRDHIMAEFHTMVAEKATHAIKSRNKFVASYPIKRYNDGKQCWINAIGEYKYNTEGRAISMFGTMQDVTESKSLELELNSSYKMAREQNNRLLNFSYIVSHNLRMHAVNIHSLLDLIAEAETEEEKKEYLAYMRVSSDNLEETLQQLNEVVAMKNTGSLQVEPIPLKKAIDRTIDLLKTNITNKNALVVNNVPAEVLINYNPGYLDSILLNFLSNAVKYSHPGRQPIITVSCIKETPATDNSRWVLSIADNGLGIDLNVNGAKLFGMYKTFHGNPDAKGIGLFMTKYQVEAMDGHIEVESKVNEGTTFKIYIK